MKYEILLMYKHDIITNGHPVHMTIMKHLPVLALLISEVINM